MGDENTNPGSGAPGAQSGAGAGAKGDSPQNQGNNNTSGKTVSWEDHQRALQDVHKFKGEVNDLKAKLEEQNSAALKQNGDYQKLYEGEKQKRTELEKQLKDVITFNANTHRFNEVRAAATGAGLRKEAIKDLELLDLSALPVELTNRNRYIVEGVSGFVESLKTEKPHWFQNMTPPNFNGGGGAPPPKDESGALTANDVAQAEIKYRRGQITKADYVKVHERYVEQQKKARQQTS